MEDFKFSICEDVAEVLDFDAEADVGLVDAVAVHGVLVREAREGARDVDIERLFPDGAAEAFDELVHVLAIDEGHLQIDLRELWLTVCAEVFVAVTAGEAVVLLDAGDHEHLLVLLWGLAEGVEVAGVEAAGHEELARAFGGGFEEGGCLDFEEALLVHVGAGGVGGLVARLECLEHFGAAEVEVAVLEAEVVVDLLGLDVVEGEGGRFGDVVDSDLAGVDLDFASCHLRVDGGIHAGLDRAEHLDDGLVLELG